MTVPMENKRGKNKIRKIHKKERVEKKYYLKRILAVYFMTFTRVHERWGKGITKNIQDYIWRREE